MSGTDWRRVEVSGLRMPLVERVHAPRDEASGVGRRELLGWIGLAGGSLLLGCSPRLDESPAGAGASCVLTPRQIEGPYFVEDRLERSDLRLDPSDGSVTRGVPLALDLRVQAVRGADCTPLVGALVDVWQCDALGRYSDVRDPWFDTRGRAFLRGFQHSDAGGRAEFTTIYPGWYPGRAVHVHFRVRVRTQGGRDVELASQLYFDEDVTRSVHRQEPYRDRGSAPPNGADPIFRRGGELLTLRPTPTGSGYAARFDIGLRIV